MINVTFYWEEKLENVTQKFKEEALRLRILVEYLERKVERLVGQVAYMNVTVLQAGQRAMEQVAHLEEVRARVAEAEVRQRELDIEKSAGARRLADYKGKIESELIREREKERRETEMELEGVRMKGAK